MELKLLGNLPGVDVNDSGSNVKAEGGHQTERLARMLASRPEFKRSQRLRVYLLASA